MVQTGPHEARELDVRPGIDLTTWIGCVNREGQCDSPGKTLEKDVQDLCSNYQMKGFLKLPLDC